MRKLTGMLLLVLGTASFALAGVGPICAAPEVDPGSAASALTILAGVLMVRKRR